MMDKKCKQCRREGKKLLLKGERCDTVKCAFVKKPYAPGIHGKNRKKTSSEYGKQLREKQKVKEIYGIRERQFKNYFQSVMHKKGVTGDMFLQKLESRLDNLIYRSGLAVSRAQSRQLVSHGFFYVKGRKVNIPSYLVKIGDLIEVKEGKKKTQYWINILPYFKKSEDKSWFKTDREKGKVEIKSMPILEDFEMGLDMSLIVEFYSR